MKIKIRSKIIFKLVILILFCFVIASDKPEAIKVIEGSTAGVIGSVLGGITAGISIIFGILATMKSDDKLDRLRNKELLKFLDNLKFDVKILVYCLLLSIMLPYFRATSLPVNLIPSSFKIDGLTSNTVYSTLELTIISISMITLLEIINVMFYVFKTSLKKEDQQG